MKRSLSNNQKSNNNKIKPTVDKNINYIEIAIGSKNQRNLNSLKSNKNTNINKNVINNFKVSNTSNKNQNQNAIKGFGVINKNINNPKKTEYDKPSLKYSHIKSSDPFAVGKKHKTNFGYVYSAGGIPCRIEHGSVRLKLKWDIEPDKLDYDPILLVCFEGLLETDHPYNFASRQCIKEMLKAPGAYDKVVPIISKIINPLRMALSTNNETYSDTLEITQMLSVLIKDKFNPYLHFILQQINKKSFNIKFKEKVFDLLRILELNGGEEALKEIKKKIPTYVSTI